MIISRMQEGGQKFGPLPVGIYNAVVESAAEGISAQSKSKLTIVFNVERADGSIGKLTANEPLGVGFRVNRLVDAFAGSDGRFDTARMPGMPCRVKVKHEPGYNDASTIRATVDEILPPSAGASHQYQDRAPANAAAAPQPIANPDDCPF